jgi:hypothetical protein
VDATVVLGAALAAARGSAVASVASVVLAFSPLQPTDKNATEKPPAR